MNDEQIIGQGKPYEEGDAYYDGPDPFFARHKFIIPSLVKAASVLT